MRDCIHYVFLLFVLLLACQDTSENSRKSSLTAIDYKSIGEQIPMDDAMRWLALYKSKNNILAREGNLFSVSKSAMNIVLQSIPEAMGMVFHYGIDEDGESHIILIPIDDKLSLWSDISGRKYLDANTGTAIDQSDAQIWAQNYKHANPGTVWFHFFGIHVFDEINAIPYFTSLDIAPAINDIDLTPQILLFVWNYSQSSGGKTSSSEEEGVAFDKSNPCPPCAIDN